MERELESAFSVIARYYTSDMQPYELDEYFEQFSVSKNHYSKQIRGIYEGVSINERHIWHQESELRRSVNHGDLRTRILHSLGFRVTEADNVLGHITVNSQPLLPLGQVFHANRATSELKQLDSSDAVFVSALLETTVGSLTTSRPALISHAAELSWYQHFNEEVTVSELAIPRALVPRIRSWNRMREDLHIGRTKKKEVGLKLGRLYMDDLRCIVGVAVLYLPGYVQISLTIDNQVHAAKAYWDRRLLSLGQDLGFKGPSVYSLATPFFSNNSVQIHRMTWLLDQEPDSIIRLYSRIFSHRTVEVTVFSGMLDRTIKYPPLRRDDVVRALHDASIVEVTTAAESGLA